MLSFLRRFGFWLGLACIGISALLLTTSLLVPISPIQRLPYLLAASTSIFLIWQVKANRHADLGLAICLMAVTSWLIVSNVPKSEILTSRASSSYTSWLNRLFDEEIGILPALKVFHWSGGLERSEGEVHTFKKIDELYREMRKDVGRFGSPMFKMIFGLQTEKDFDILIFNPTTQNKGTLIFLHGASGPWSLVCWIISKAAAENGLQTVCPSTFIGGPWSSKKGRKIIRSTIEFVKERGGRPRFLAGYSNGAIGASFHAKHFENEFEGLLLLFGYIDGGARSDSIPSHYLFGTDDVRFPVKFAHEIINFSENGLISGEEISSDHIAPIKKPELVQAAISRWLKTFETQ